MAVPATEPDTPERLSAIARATLTRMVATDRPGTNPDPQPRPGHTPHLDTASHQVAVH